ncbi:uncharacterized protein Z519_02218 [Cladophialophora bantiana CBS 173.52]|uniref:Uncharacterized protein n=1 Tax=Cladophialophora bantiana (strain ATCC 10958 / CBS 173.52 / CDC B-1940 / NIH 8579) TaxID=1442370 RepID=A0A0D2GEM9_CLAB1|nr:uncharacterized protein Z519_02218 [Cladophialophora bantiana CBS 173.52]KIW96827.1 hypothetical protein Z519_02218 [Cladophialophora bantiana CBS 173.52]
MATPHRGSDAARIGKLVQKAAQYTWRKPNIDFLNILERNSPSLFKQLKNFTTISPQMSRFCLYETIPSSIGLIVPLDSAVFDGFGVESSHIPGDHLGMCKFENRNSGGYKRVLRYIRRMVNDASNASRLTRERPAKIARRGSPMAGRSENKHLLEDNGPGTV